MFQLSHLSFKEQFFLFVFFIDCLLIFCHHKFSIFNQFILLKFLPLEGKLGLICVGLARSGEGFGRIFHSLHMDTLGTQYHFSVSKARSSPEDINLAYSFGAVERLHCSSMTLKFFVFFLPEIQVTCSDLDIHFPSLPYHI